MGSFHRLKVALIACLLASVTAIHTTWAAPPAGYTLAWSDEFNGDEIDPTRWTRFRTDAQFAATHDRVENTFMQDGYLTIAAHTNAQGLNTTGSLITQGRESFHHGYFETRMRHRGAQGLNQAFWIQSPTMTLTNGNVPGSPDIYGTEIDVTEHRLIDGNGTNISDRMRHALHWDGYGADRMSTGSFAPAGLVNDFNNEWHTFALEWTPTSYKFFINGTLTEEYTQAVSRRDHHIILSNAVFPAGNFTNGPPPGGYGPLESMLYGFDIDYVRYYTNPATEVTEEDQTISINFTNNNSAEQQVNGAFGVASESSVVDGWNNLNITSNVVDGSFVHENVNYRDGRRSAVDLTLNKPYSGLGFSSALDNTPFRLGATDFVTSPDAIEVTLSELDIAFDGGYKVIAYMTGLPGNEGASISDGTTTYYFQTPNPESSTLIQTTDTNPNDGIPVANFAVFGTDYDPLFEESLTITLDTIDFAPQHAPALGGLQLVEADQTFGDFTRDGVINSEDLDLLTQAVGGPDGQYNLNNFTDAVVDEEDRRIWLQYVGNISYGDANFDGIVNETDLQTLAAFLFAANGKWSEGDFNGDGVTDGLDLDIIEQNWHDGDIIAFNVAAAANGLLLPADYNDDGIVDAADYTVVRDSLGSAEGTLPNDIIGGVVSSQHIQVWQTYFGASLSLSSASAFSSTAIPEPSTQMLVAITFSSLLSQQRIR